MSSFDPFHGGWLSDPKLCRSTIVPPSLHSLCSGYFLYIHETRAHASATVPSPGMGCVPWLGMIQTA